MSYWDLQHSTAASGSSTPPTTPGSSLSREDNISPFRAPATSAGHSSPSTTGNGFILVTGGLGFIGSHTCVELLKAGFNVIIVDNLSNSFETVFTRIRKLAMKHFEGTPRKMPLLQFHKLDYRSNSMRFLLESYSDIITISDTNPDAMPGLRRQSRITGVIHFAAFKSVPQSIEEPISYYRNNVNGLVDLVDLLGKHSIRNFVFSSSATVYGARADLGVPLKEEDLVHHTETYVDEKGLSQVTEPEISGLQSPYARTKYFCEAILADIAKSDPSWRITALRYFNPVGCDPSGLLGEDPKGIPTNLFPVITQVLTGAREELSVFGSDWDTRDGTAIRDFVHVSDIARGHVAAFKKAGSAPFRAFNLGSGTGTTVIEAVRSLEAAASRPIPVGWSGRREGDVGICVASSERAMRELGWTANESILQCAKDLWNYVSKLQV